MEESKEKKKKDPIWKHAKVSPTKYNNASQLWNDALLYFEWCDENPVDAPMTKIGSQREKHGGHKEVRSQKQQDNISRPYTLYGFCAFTGITKWSAFKAKYVGVEGMEDFENVILTIENVIASQQIDGALTGVFKENLAARLNGLADKNVQEMNGEIDVKNEHKFSGFNFLPWQSGLQNSEQSKIASGEVIEVKPEPEPVYAEIIDYNTTL